MELKNQLAWNIEDLRPKLEQAEDVAEKQYEENHVFLVAFSSDAGKKVLEWMERHTLQAPTWWPIGNYDQNVANGFFREGQNHLVKQIKAKIDQARNHVERKK